jgi:hypothetical protein
LPADLYLNGGMMKIKILSLNKPIGDYHNLELVESVIKPRMLPVQLFTNDELITIVYKSQIIIEGNVVFIENPKIPSRYHHLCPHLHINAIHEVLTRELTRIKQAEMVVIYLASHANADESIKSINEQIQDQLKQPTYIERDAGISDPTSLSLHSD